MPTETHGLLFHNPMLSIAIVALVIAVLLTAFFFRKGRKHEHGHIKGVAADPAKVRRDNPPDA